MVAMRKQGDTLQSIGDAFGLTRERARQLLVGTDAPTVAELAAARAERATKDAAEHAQVAADFLDAHPGATAAQVAGHVSVPEGAVMGLVRGTGRLGLLANVDGSGAPRVTDETIFAGLRAAAAHTPGGVLTVARYERWRRTHPAAVSSALTYQRFTSWVDVCARAGVRPGTARRSYTKTFTDDVCLDALGRFLSAGGCSVSVDAYRVWRATDPGVAPSAILLRNRFGGWSEARNLARARLADRAD
jgi:hypothetical protein